MRTTGLPTVSIKCQHLGGGETQRGPCPVRLNKFEHVWEVLYGELWWIMGNSYMSPLPSVDRKIQLKTLPSPFIWWAVKRMPLEAAIYILCFLAPFSCTESYWWTITLIGTYSFLRPIIYRLGSTAFWPSPLLFLRFQASTGLLDVKGLMILFGAFQLVASLSCIFLLKRTKTIVGGYVSLDDSNVKDKNVTQSETKTGETEDPMKLTDEVTTLKKALVLRNMPMKRRHWLETLKNPQMKTMQSRKR